MNSTTPLALSDEELSELDSFLLSDACDDETLSVDELHGFLTAISLGQEPLSEAEWLPQIWGEPSFSDEEERAHILTLVRRLLQDIEAGLQGVHEFEPLAVEVEEEGVDVVAYEGWCFGFMLGVEAQQSQWDSLPKDESALLAPMAQLALLNSEEEPSMDDDEYESWVELLPGAVRGLYSYWHEG